jgi:hypothetical protein
VWAAGASAHSTYHGPNEPTEQQCARDSAPSFTILSGENLSFATLRWDLPLGTWDFDEVRSFTLLIDQGIFNNDLNLGVENKDDLLAAVANARFTFWADDNIPIDQSSGLLDNFVVPEATTGAPAAPAVILVLARRRRKTKANSVPTTEK